MVLDIDHYCNYFMPLASSLVCLTIQKPVIFVENFELTYFELRWIGILQ